MKYIEAPNKYNGNLSRSIFLAGGITNCPNWQQELVNLLEETNLVIFNPRRDHFPIDDPTAAPKQIKWEYNMFKKAKAISFWFSRGSVNPIVLFEYGKWFKSKKKIFCGIDPKYSRRQDVEIQTKLEGLDIEIVYSLEDLAKQIKKEIVQKANMLY
jgi:hypothetical protein